MYLWAVLCVFCCAYLPQVLLAFPVRQSALPKWWEEDQWTPYAYYYNPGMPSGDLSRPSGSTEQENAQWTQIQPTFPKRRWLFPKTGVAGLPYAISDCPGDLSNFASQFRRISRGRGETNNLLAALYSYCVNKQT